LLVGTVVGVAFLFLNRKENSGKMLGEVKNIATEGVSGLRKEATENAAASLKKASEYEAEAGKISQEEIEENKKIDDMSEDEFLAHLNRK